MNQTGKQYDLEERTLEFAKRVRRKKDFALRIKICRKEAKECRFWLRLVDTGKQPEVEQEREELINESQELMNIFGAILRKVK